GRPEHDELWPGNAHSSACGPDGTLRGFGSVAPDVYPPTRSSPIPSRSSPIPTSQWLARARSYYGGCGESPPAPLLCITAAPRPPPFGGDPGLPAPPLAASSYLLNCGSRESQKSDRLRRSGRPLSKRGTP